MKKFTTLLITFFFLLSSLYAQTGWMWQNPLPQGNELYGISFIRNHGWAVGPNGTAIHTTDGGDTWYRVDLGTRENFNAVCMHDDLMTWIAGDNGLILFVMEHMDDSTFEVTRQQSHTDVNLRSVTSDINGCPWVAGDDGTVLRSNDFGESWEVQPVQFSYDLYGLHNIECMEAWAVGPDGFMMYTYDGGHSWSYLPSPTSYWLLSVDVGTFENIRVTGQQGLIMHTTDKGITWTIENQGAGYNLNDVINIGLNAAYAVGTEETILETVDAGATWTEPGTDIQLYTTPLYDVEDQWAHDNIWVVGHHGVILRNSGVQTEFEVQNIGTLYDIHDADFVDENTGWAVGGEYVDSGNSVGIILKTTDGGETWEEQSHLTVLLTDVDFINENEGWAVGRNGTIKHTSTGGESWGTQDSPVSGLLTSVCFVDENNGWAVSRDNWGEVIHTNNGGATWTKQTNPSANPLHDVFFIDENTGWAVGLDSSVIRTSNGGETWQWYNVGASQGYRFASVYFVDEMYGWISGIYGSILRTTDGGDTWDEIETGSYDTFYDIYFVDRNNGWAVGDQGTILRSVDAGEHWFRQFSGVATNSLSSVFFTDLGNGWVTGEGGTIIHTTNGGFSHYPGTFWEAGLGLPINDMEETTSTIVVDVSEVIRDEYMLTGVELFIDTILHAQVSDLEIYLSHNDITDTLVFHVADDGENFLWTTFKDDAAMMISDGTAPFSGDYRPYRPLAAFNGGDPNGEWTLTIYDSEAGHTGTLNAWGIRPVFEKLVSVPEVTSVPKSDIHLYQNVPNPFNGTAQITWKSEIGGVTTLGIFNISGQKVVQLINKKMPAGEHSVSFDGTHLPNGIYYYQLRIGAQMQTKKMIITGNR